ncbi:MAG: DNA polymerase IV [Ignavibacteria bacterium]|nr:DNA polymerase IV [Ignavibacteria bacterium]
MKKASSYFFIPRESDSLSGVFKRVRLMPLYSHPHFKDLNPNLTEHRDRCFIHIDFDAFYAQVEQRDNPKLRGKPVSVGGTPDGKGIVMTASYEARAFGVDTGMSVWQAKKLCPQLISIPCYGPKYEAIMESIMEVLQEFAPSENIEQYSIDECFIDISHLVKNSDSQTINWEQVLSVARQIKSRIRIRENLTTSLGCSYNKTYAKIATKLEKPDGLTIITPKDKSIIYQLPVKKIWGIGTRIARRLSVYNIFTIGDLANTPAHILHHEFGINGIVYRKLARGEDTSEIFHKQEHEKAISHQHTLSNPIYKSDEVKQEIRRICEYIGRKLRDKNLVTGYLVFVIRYENLKYAAEDLKLKVYTNDDRELFSAVIQIYKKLPAPRSNVRARLFGLIASNLLTDSRCENFNLFNNKVSVPYYTLDEIKYKYGEKIIRVGISR